MDVGNSFGMVETYLPLQIIALRLLIAAALGAIIGLERETHTAQAGLRTHILVALAAALFTILSFEIFHTIENGQGSQADPIRAVEAVTAGIAFLGAGAIFRDHGALQGLTTGAGMWLAGATGVAVALGYYPVAFGVALLALLVLSALRTFAHGVVRGKARPSASDKEQRTGLGNAASLRSQMKQGKPPSA